MYIAMKSENTIILSGILLLIALIAVWAYTSLVPVSVGEVLTWDFKEGEEKSDFLSGSQLLSGDLEIEALSWEILSAEEESELSALTSPSRHQESALQHWATIEPSTKTSDQVPFCDELTEQEQLLTQCQLRTL